MQKSFANIGALLQATVRPQPAEPEPGQQAASDPGTGYATSSDGQTAFRFLDLPREIRDEVYRIPFKSSNMIYASRQSGISDYLSLLRANRQIYSEAAEMLYSYNTFYIPASLAEDFFLVLSGRDTTGSNQICLARHYLKRVCIHFTNYSASLLTKDLVVTLKRFTNLASLRLIFKALIPDSDMNCVMSCLIFLNQLQSLPKKTFKDVVLLKRTSATEAEDISWMLQEEPRGLWERVEREDGVHVWRNEHHAEKITQVVQISTDIWFSKP
ncbi:hypothetical protein G7Y89_g3248 [Cudoniella acicularis]|uniref:Uncharacterized protein n=1 Tax=Cudoniella acicularis TaxID=354080 RepID=A0A8H4RUQ7_9HELO|nr:hypothetical protein G7Y89_g3248 [Cudoniella acicularis]